MNNPVLIYGSGFSASCCSRLLSEAKVPFCLTSGPRNHVPAILVGEATRQLFADIFHSPDLFSSNHQILRRIVAWGPDAQPNELPHDARIVSEESFSPHQQAIEAAQSSQPPAWSLYCARSPAMASTQHVFGSRIAYTATVQLKLSAERAACWIESLDAGWLFLFTTGNDDAWLLAVGASYDSLLSQSRVISSRVNSMVATGAKFPASPRIAHPLSASSFEEAGWLLCGSAALSFDPVCGDGSGNAVRESILACAVVRAILAGEPAADALNHYSGRLLAGFLRHLQLCRKFYETGGVGPWWTEQVAQLDEGIRWTHAQLSALPPSPFRLNDFSLERIAR